MSGGFDIQAETLGAAGKQLAGVADRLTEVLSAFRSELESYGQPWGADDIGSLIGVAHDEVSAWAFECFDTALEEIGAAGADLGGAAERYTAVEEAVHGRFQDIHRGLGG